MSNGRAPIGGTTGVNGERYEGGQFLPSTELPKQTAKARRAATAKQEIAPYVWEVAPAGKTSLYRPISAFLDAQRLRSTGVAAAHMPSIEGHARMYSTFNVAEMLLLIEAYEAGERWMNAG